MNITEFLEARIAEDEWQAQLRREMGWIPRQGIPSAAPARTLAECAAKRAIIGSLTSTSAAHANEEHLGQKLVLAGMDTGLRLALQYLAGVYKDHPDYQQDWAIDSPSQS